MKRPGLEAFSDCRRHGETLPSRIDDHKRHPPAIALSTRFLSQEDAVMSPGEIAVLGLIIFAFSSFAAVLAWASTGSAGADRRQRDDASRRGEAFPPGGIDDAVYDD
jgi:hypothetical protein